MDNEEWIDPDSFELNTFMVYGQRLSTNDIGWLLREIWHMYWDYEILGQPCGSHHTNIKAFITRHSNTWPTKRVVKGIERVL